MASGFVGLESFFHEESVDQVSQEGSAVGSAQQPCGDDGAAVGVCKGVGSAWVVVTLNLEFSPNYRMEMPGRE